MGPSLSPSSILLGPSSAGGKYSQMQCLQPCPWLDALETHFRMSQERRFSETVSKKCQQPAQPSRRNGTTAVGASAGWRFWLSCSGGGACWILRSTADRTRVCLWTSLHIHRKPKETAFHHSGHLRSYVATPMLAQAPLRQELAHRIVPFAPCWADVGSIRLYCSRKLIVWSLFKLHHYFTVPRMVSCTPFSLHFFIGM